MRDDDSKRVIHKFFVLLNFTYDAKFVGLWPRYKSEHLWSKKTSTDFIFVPWASLNYSITCLMWSSEEQTFGGLLLFRPAKCTIKRAFVKQNQLHTAYTCTITVSEPIIIYFLYYLFYLFFIYKIWRLEEGQHVVFIAGYYLSIKNYTW